MAVAAIFYVWRAWWRGKMRVLRERVAYMLWVIAKDTDSP